MIYLDNAATSFPKPKPVIKAVADAISKHSANPGRSGHEMSLKAAEIVFEAREKVRNFFKAKDNESVIFTKNCTESLNIVIQGILKKGDHAIISNLEHNSVLRPLVELERRGVEFSIADFWQNGNANIEQEFRRVIKANTKLLICTHASNVFGVLQPINKIAKLCKENDILFCVDAAQTAGIIPIDVQKTGVDFLCCPGHKGLYGPMGTGILVLNSVVLPEGLLFGGTGSLSLIKTQPEILPDKFESGTLNVPGIAGLSAGIEFIEKNGGDMAKEIELMSYLYDELLHNKKITLFTARPDIRKSVPLLSFAHTDYDSETVAEKLSESGIAVRAGLHCSPLAHELFGTAEKGVVRVSPSVFSKKSEIKKLIEVINRI